MVGKEVYIKFNKRSKKKLGYILLEEDSYILVAIPQSKPTKQVYQMTHGIYKISKESISSESKNRVYIEEME